MNLPNTLTLVRIFLVPLLVVVRHRSEPVDEIAEIAGVDWLRLGRR